MTMKVLSLAWKYHPSITSGVGVACEGLNNALSKIVDLTVIYPTVSKIQIKEEILLSSDDLSEGQKQKIKEEYIELVEEGKYEIAVKLDPYFVSIQSAIEHQGKNKKIRTNKIEPTTKVKRFRIRDQVLYEDVDVFGETVKDKIYLYNRLVEELAPSLEFDLIHAHDWMTFLAGIALKNKYQKPLVLHIHSLEYDRVGHKDVSWVYDIERFAMSKADHVITTSNYTKGIIESNYGLSGKHILTVHNATSIPKNYQPTKKNTTSAFNVLFVGRIDGKKGIEYFIEIARKVLKKSNNIQFLVVGRGKGKVKFEEIDGFDEIASSFNYLGFVERKKLFELYNESDVLCMPSISEPFGLTAIEAASTGLPVILSTKTGAAEILKRTPKASFWDTQKFADHILSIKKNTKIRDRIISNNKRDVSKLSWESSATQIFNLFKELQHN